LNDVGIVYLFLISAVYVILSRRNAPKSRQSLTVAWKSLVRLLPILVAIFALVGLFEVFIPQAWISARLGEASGWVSLLTGGLLGAVAMGPPVAAFPLAGSLLDGGAWPPAVAAFIVSWVSVGFVSIPFEAQIFGIRFAFLRNTLTFASALLVGWLIGVLL